MFVTVVCLEDGAFGTRVSKRVGLQRGVAREEVMGRGSWGTLPGN